MTLEQNKKDVENSNTEGQGMDKTGTNSLELQNVLPFAPPGNRELRRRQEQAKLKAEYSNEKHTKLQSPEERKKVEEQDRKHRNDTALRNLRASSTKPRTR